MLWIDGLLRAAKVKKTKQSKTLDDAAIKSQVAHKGRWRGGGDPAAAAAGRCEEQGNVNVLNSGAKSDMGESTAVHSVQVLVRRAT